MKRQEFRPVRRESVERVGPGEDFVAATPGDFVLTHGNAWTSRMIRFGQRLRIRGNDRKYTRWNHTAMIVGSDGTIIEALGRGVTQRNLSAYKPTEYHVVRVEASESDREQIVGFAKWAMDQPYGYLTIVSIAVSLLTGGKFSFAFEGQHICSGLVARALERSEAIFNRSPSHIMPADLAKYYGVEPPAAGRDKGRPPAALPGT